MFHFQIYEKKIEASLSWHFFIEKWWILDMKPKWKRTLRCSLWPCLEPRQEIQHSADFFVAQTFCCVHMFKKYSKLFLRSHAQKYSTQQIFLQPKHCQLHFSLSRFSPHPCQKKSIPKFWSMTIISLLPQSWLEIIRTRQFRSRAFWALFSGEDLTSTWSGGSGSPISLIQKHLREKCESWLERLFEWWSLIPILRRTTFYKAKQPLILENMNIISICLTFLWGWTDFEPFWFRIKRIIHSYQLLDDTTRPCTTAKVYNYWICCMLLTQWGI